MVNDDKLAALRVQRGTVKRQLTSIEKFITDKLDEANVFEIDTRLTFIDRYYDNFDLIQGQIEALVNNNSEDDERTAFEEKVMDDKAKLLAAKSQRDAGVVNQLNELNQTLAHNLSFAEHNTFHDFSHIKLPHFTGNFYEWPEFEDAVRVMLDENQLRGLTDRGRLTILKAALSGSAKTVVENLTLTEANYTIAKDRLKERFFKRKLIFDSYINKLFVLPKAEDTRSLRSLIDNALSIMRQLDKLGSTEELLAGFFSKVIFSKGDEKLIADWQQTWSETDELPLWEDVTSFIDSYCTKKETVELSMADEKLNSAKEKRKAFSALRQGGCPICAGNCKTVIECATFLSFTTQERFQACKGNQICVKCLESATPCHCQSKCKKCNGRSHHVLLHHIKQSSQRSENSESNSREGPSTAGAADNSTINLASFSSLNSKFKDMYTLLGTAVVLLQNKDKNWIPMRCLLDGGAQVHSISHRAIKRLQLPMEDGEVELDVYGGGTCKLRKEASLTIKSRTTAGVIFEVTASVLNDSKARQPIKKIDVSKWQIPQKLILADTNFNVPDTFDLILGNGIVSKIDAVGRISLGDDKPILKKTLFGWIVHGDMFFPRDKAVCAPMLSYLATSTSHAKEMESLSKFWELEECESPLKTNFILKSAEEQFCEDEFQRSVKRDVTGRVSVKLPFKYSPNSLGLSYNIVLSRLLNIEAKLNKNPGYKKIYNDQLAEYLNLGHMTEIPKEEAAVFLPHFYVLKLESTSTPLRIVFDASCPTSNGRSLNDVLAVGPVIQKTLYANLLRARFPLVLISADVAKMYRQVLVDEGHRKFQCILWRDESGAVKSYSLNRITFGTGPASFLACRTMTYLAEQEADFPLGSEVVRDSFYVDNALFGSDTSQEAIEKLRQTQALLMTGQLPLKKIMSNCPEVMASFPESDHDDVLKLGSDEAIKTLGLYWIPKEDVFRYDCKVGTERITKRKILSETAAIFDPLGFVQPAIVSAKIMNQQICRLKLGWDEGVSDDIHTAWKRFRSELVALQKVVVPRCVMRSEVESVQYHGFCDASMKAYAAVIYVRVEGSGGEIMSNILTSKTRVAPRKTETLARLELCGALLLARLMKVVLAECPVVDNQAKIFCWSDSKTALRWISEEPCRWVQFVANRSAEIQRLLPKVEWRHVPGSLNTADIASRGIWPSEMLAYPEWFAGPTFLKESPKAWPAHEELPEEVPEERKFKFGMLGLRSEPDPVTSCKFSNLKSITKVFAYCQRFIQNLKKKLDESKKKGRKCTAVTISPKSIILRPIDIRKGEQLMIKFVQRACFPETIFELENKESVTNNRLQRLRLFLDKGGILRSAGRLGLCAEISYDTKYPAILPKNHRLTTEIFCDTHLRTGHAGPSALLAEVCQKFWPLNGKVIANKTVRRCVLCQRLKPTPFTQIMGDLPRDRVARVERPFLVSGVDFAGPILIHQKGRGSRPKKGYLAIFVCFSTKAVYIDIAEDLSTEAFINVLRRFCARHGTPQRIWSDNGSNFKGASNFFKKLDRNFDLETFWTTVYEWSVTQKSIEFKFIPPYSPNHGGLWEAAVKMAKHHLIRIFGSAKLIHDELHTVVAEIAALLNNRPLCPFSLIPGEDIPLTPAHFLIGQPFGSLIEPNLANVNPSSLNRWRLLTALKQSFWIKWSHEYLTHLQQRSKWFKEQPNLKKDDVVLIVDKNLPSKSWSLGRIIKPVVSSDGKVRTLALKTATGETTRAVHQLCPLFVER